MRAIKIAFFAIIAVGVVSFLVMSLWNALLPGIFMVKTITFWQALGLLVLSKLLFGGFRPPGGGGRHWRRRMAERWEQMTPEEREKFKQGTRCGFRRGHEEATNRADRQEHRHESQLFDKDGTGLGGCARRAPVGLYRRTASKTRGTRRLFGQFCAFVRCR